MGRRNRKSRRRVPRVEEDPIIRELVNRIEAIEAHLRVRDKRLKGIVVVTGPGQVVAYPPTEWETP